MAELLVDAPEIPNFYPYADGFAVGDNTATYITRMREVVEPGEVPSGELLVGDVLRRTCDLGKSACATTCKLAELRASSDKRCSDENLGKVTEMMGIRPEALLMVGVSADNVGFYDQMSEYSNQVKTNSVGIRELPGFNAFFAKASEDVVLGARLADCGFAAVEFKDREGEDILGFVHLTRTNLQGESALAFEVNGKPAGSFEYFMDQALTHYGGDISTASVRVVAAIKGENFHQRFTTQTPEQRFPGWIEQGLLVNISNPEWQPGDPINPEDVWQPDYREMVRWQIARSGISPEQVTEEDMIDPGDLEQGHASNHAGAHGKMPDGRDAYLVMSRSYQ